MVRLRGLAVDERLGEHHPPPEPPPPAVEVVPRVEGLAGVATGGHHVDRLDEVADRHDRPPHRPARQRRELERQRCDVARQPHAPEGQLEQLGVLGGAARQLAVVGVEQRQADHVVGEQADVVLRLAVHVEAGAAAHRDRRVPREDGHVQAPGHGEPQQRPHGQPRLDGHLPELGVVAEDAVEVPRRDGGGARRRGRQGVAQPRAPDRVGPGLGQALAQLAVAVGRRHRGRARLGAVEADDIDGPRHRAPANMRGPDRRLTGPSRLRRRASRRRPGTACR